MAEAAAAFELTVELMMKEGPLVSSGREGSILGSMLPHSGGVDEEWDGIGKDQERSSFNTHAIYM